MLSFVIVGFIWKLILSPLWGLPIGPHERAWLGSDDLALTTLSLISVWQFVGIPMMLIYAVLLAIPDEVIEAARIDGAGWRRSSGRSSCR